MLHAFLKNNTILLIDSISEEEYHLHIREWDSIIKIQDMVPLPKVGWILQGNKLVPVDALFQQTQQQVFGASLALELVNKMGARNLILSSQGSSVNVSSLLANVGTIRSLIETGALKTARTAMQSLLPLYPDYSDIFNFGIMQISQFLSSRGWD